LEDNSASWDKEQQVWKVVTKLGIATQGHQGYLREFLYGRDAARRMSSKGIKRKILEKILPKCVARRLKTKMDGIMISPLV
jgi:hypothetical protein